jgi:hypothetical protein
VTKSLSYYLDSSSLDRIAKSPKREEIVSLLRALRDAGKLVTYMSVWTLTEIFATFEKKPDLARQLVFLLLILRLHLAL